MLKFLRNTHTPDGTYRFCPVAPNGEYGNPHRFGGDKKTFEEYDHADFVVHMLDSTKPMSFFEVVQAVQKYDLDFAWENGNRVTSKEQVALGLIACLEQDLAKVVEAPEKESEL